MKKHKFIGGIILLLVFMLVFEVVAIENINNTEKNEILSSVEKLSKNKLNYHEVVNQFREIGSPVVSVLSTSLQNHEISWNQNR